MPPAVPIGFDPSSKKPFFGVVVRLGVGAKAQPAARRILILANMIATAITRANITGSDGVAQTFPDVAAGTAAMSTPVAVPSPDDADLMFGRGSEAALMCRAVFAQRADADVTVCPVAEGVSGSPTKATATLLFANAAGAAGVVRLVISGQTVPDIAVASGQTAANIAADVAIAINRQSNLPVVATVATATVTLQAKQIGPRGNSLAVECALTTTTTTVALNGGAASATIVRGRLASGASPDVFSTALAAVASGEFVIAAACEDATNIGLVRAHLATYSAINERKRQQSACGLKTQSVPGAIAFNTGVNAINAARIQLIYQRDSGAGGAVDPWTPSTGELAADAVAARLYGDGAVGNGGRVRGEIANPAQNLDGVKLGGVKCPRLASCNLLGVEIEQLLSAGITPLAPSLANPGFSQIIKSVTSYWQDGLGGATTAVHDTSAVTVADHVAELIENAVAGEFPNKNIAPEPATPQAPPTEDVIYASMVKSTVVRVLRECEAAGLLVDVEKYVPAVVVEQHPDFPSTIVAQIPVRVIRHFHAFAGELQQLA